jgi:integrase
VAVRKSGDRWIVEFMFRGVRVFRRLPAGRNKGDAQQVEARLRNQIFDSVDLGRLPDPLLSKVIDEWLETKRHSKAAAHTRGHAGLVRAAVEGLRFSDMGVAADGLRGRVDLAPATRNRRLCILKAVAKYAYQKGYAKENLSAKITLLPERQYTRRDITADKVSAVLSAASTPRARALIAFAAYTGMRLGEILKLTPQDVVGGFIRVRDPKNGQDRDVPIPTPLKPHLGALPFKGNWRNVYRGWIAARKRAGVDMRFHDLRHHAATAMAEGRDTILLMDVMGWKSVQTARRYVHPSMAAKAKLMQGYIKITSGGKEKITSRITAGTARKKSMWPGSQKRAGF